MAQLYGKCFDNENILLAGKIINKTINNINDIKMILRRCYKLKYNINNNQLILSDNIYIAHQSIYQIIQPIIEKNISSNSYAFKKNINEKIPICKICSKITNTNHTFIIQFDYTSYILNINTNDKLQLFLNQALDNLRLLGITDAKVLKTIKYLLCIKLQNPCMLLQQTLLGQVLINCFLYSIDQLISTIIDKPSKNFSTDFKRHKNDYIQWLYKRNRKPSGLYYRYLYNGIILCNSEVEQIEIYKKLNNVISNLQLSYNQFNFLDYRIIKRFENNIPKIGITPANPFRIRQLIKSTKWNNIKDICNSMNIILKIFNKYDICNNMKFYLNQLSLRMLKISKRKNSILIKIPNKVIYKYTDKKIEYFINIYELRKLMKISFKEYLLHPQFLVAKDKMNYLTIHAQAHQFYKWALWIKQKGKDIDNTFLQLKNNHIHHINGKHTDNRFCNLILVNIQTHKLIHSSELNSNKIIEKYQKLLK